MTNDEFEEKTKLLIETIESLNRDELIIMLKRFMRREWDFTYLIGIQRKTIEFYAFCNLNFANNKRAHETRVEVIKKLKEMGLEI